MNYIHYCLVFNFGYLAFSEMVPVLHITGVPSTDQQAHKSLLHHTLGDGRQVPQSSVHM